MGDSFIEHITSAPDATDSDIKALGLLEKIATKYTITPTEG